MKRWRNQEEAYQFAMSHDSCMLDMDMGTGKTRVAIDLILDRPKVNTVLVVCPKAVIPVWRTNFEKFYPVNNLWDVWDETKGTIKSKMESISNFMTENSVPKKIVVVNYDIVWRAPLGEYIHKFGFDMIILDESHRAKSAGSKVSKFLGMVGKKVPYKLCLSGTPMANSPLDIYGQYRFLDNTIFGTNYNRFCNQYAIMGGPDGNWVVGYKNGNELNRKFNSIAYHCSMLDVADRLKLPEALPPIVRHVTLPPESLRISKQLSKEFIAEYDGKFTTAKNALVKLLRLQQIASGFCMTQENPLDTPILTELNASKCYQLLDDLGDISPVASVVVFCVFTHDLDAVAGVCDEAKRKHFELSGRCNQLEEWKKHPGAVMIVQIQSGAEGIDMTMANYGYYFSLPHSLAVYEQSKARLYRPGQTKPVSFVHLIADGTVDVGMYKSLAAKKDVIQSIKEGIFDYGYKR